VQYEGERAAAACGVAPSWTSAETCEERAASIAAVRPYRAGAFYERELPCILEVLALVRTPVRAVLVDGYVELDERGTPGLGARLHASLAGAIPVVGVAKTPYGEGAFAARVLRGTSRRPLFVTARGLPVARAAELVRAMEGAHRVPTLLARVDRLARDALRSS
jgi:deoxyribonuclease V